VKLSADLVADKYFRADGQSAFIIAAQGAQGKKKSRRDPAAQLQRKRLLVVASVVSMIAVAVIIAVLPDARMVLRHIDISVPPVADEIDGMAARIVSVAVTAPVFRMTGRDAHVDRLSNDDGCGPNHDRASVYDFRLREASDIDTAVKPRLPDTDGDTDIGGVRRGGDKGHHDGK